MEPLEKVYDRDLDAENEAEVEMIRYEESKWAKDAQIERWIESRDENDDLEVMKLMPSMLPITVIAEKDAIDEDSSLNTDSMTEELDVTDSAINEESKDKNSGTLDESSYRSTITPNKKKKKRKIQKVVR